MNTLPNELMVKILKNLKHSDLDNSVDVCDFWRDLIYNGVGVQRCIGVIHPGILLYEELPKLMEFKEIGEIGMNYCVIGDICDDEKLPNYRSAYLVKKMGFIGLISEEIFKKMTNPLNNLTSLSFELKTLNNFQFSSGLQFPNLKHFKLIGLNSCAMEIKEDNLWMNFIRIFLESYFPQLQVLNLIEVPLITSDDGRILVDALIVFINKHKQTIKSFCLIVSNIFLFKEWRVGHIIPEIPQIQMTNQFQWDNFQFTSYSQNPPLSQNFNWILKNQMNLKVYMDTDFLRRFDPNFIQQNSSTLVTIELFIPCEPEEASVMDLDIFKNCSALKHITLHGPGNHRITNAKCLPPSMHSIRILNFRMDSKDASELMTRKWTHLLKSLELFSFRYGDGETLGVPFDAICTLLKQKTIARVFISPHGINKTSFDTAKLTFTNTTDLPGLARRILERVGNDEIQFGLDIDKNYVFMDWMRLDRRLYIPGESNQVNVDGCGRFIYKNMNI